MQHNGLFDVLDYFMHLGPLGLLTCGVQVVLRSQGAGLGLAPSLHPKP